MKVLIRVATVLAAVAICAPALACSEYQQTTAQQTEGAQAPNVNLDNLTAAAP